MTYKAFISYSHAADNQFAPIIQRSLHKFAKPFYRRQAIRVFRDETSLNLTPELWPRIQQALSESEYFIMMASPDAAKSQWVQQEANEWLRLKNNSTNEFLIILTDGEISWDKSTGGLDWSRTTALPDNLRGAFKTEPFYLDLRWAKEETQETDLSLRHPRFLDKIGTLAATLHGKSKDEMIGIDVRQHRIFKTVVAAAIALLVVLFILALGAAYYANVQRRYANAQRSEAEHQRDEADSQRQKAVEEALNATRSHRREKRERLKAQEAAKAETRQRKRAEIATVNEQEARQRAEERRKEAERQTRRAIAGQFAAHAQANLEKNPQLSLLSSIEAVNTTREHNEPTVRAAEQSLRLALAKFGKGSVSVPPGDNTIQPSNADMPSSPPARVDLLNKTAPGGGKNGSIGASDDGRWVVMATDDKTIRILDLKAPKPDESAHTISEFKDRAPKVFFDHPSRWLLIVSRDGNARLCDISKGYAPNKSYPFSVLKNFVSRIEFSVDGRCLPFVNDSGMVQLFDLSAENPVVKPHDLYRINTEFLRDDDTLDVRFNFSQDGRWLAVNEPDEAIQDTAGLSVGNNIIGLWDRHDNRLHLLQGHKYWVKWVRFSPDSHWLLSSNVSSDVEDAKKDESKVILWDLKSKTPETRYHMLLGHEDWVQVFEFSQNGHWLFTGSERGQLWNLLAKDPSTHPQSLPGFKGRMVINAPIEFVSNGNWLMVTGSLGIDMWDLRYPAPTYLPVRKLGLVDQRETPSISPNGRWMAKIHSGGTVLLWDLTTENPSANQLIISGLDENIESVSFCPDSRWMIAEWPDKHRQLLNLDLSEMMEQAGAEARRNLTWEEWTQVSPENVYHRTVARLPVENLVIEGMVDQAHALLSRGDRDGAYSAYKNMAEWAIAQNDAMLCNYVCLSGSVDGFAAVVLKAGEHAVALEEDNDYLKDAQGLARALTGDYSKAIKDFEAYISWIQGNTFLKPFLGLHIQAREEWIARLKAKKNPFNKKALLEARNQMLTAYYNAKE